MPFDVLAGLVAALGLAVYLAYVLARPERF